MPTYRAPVKDTLFVLEAVAGLAENERDAVLLRFFHGLTFDAIDDADARRRRGRRRRRRRRRWR